MFRHPNYYKELRKLRNKSDQAISSKNSATERIKRSPGPGPKQQASSAKLQAQAEADKRQASSVAKASSFKPQASSAKIPEPGNK